MLQAVWEAARHHSLEGTVVFMIFVYLFETLLQVKQYRRCLNTTRIPTKLKDVIEVETFSKAQQYSADKNMYGLVKDTYSTVELIALLYYNAIPWLWAHCGEHTDFFARVLEKELAQSLLFFTATTLFSLVTSMPWKLYSTFVLEQRHGFNNMTLKLFIRDRILGLALTFAIGAPVLLALISIIQWGGNHFVFYVWLFILAFSLFIMTIYPNLIAPLFDTYVTMPACELRTAIEALAERVSFPLTQLYVVLASARSSHSNAYFYGFFKSKRVVLFDTLLEQPVMDLIKTENPTSAKDIDASEEKRKKSGQSSSVCTTQETVAILAHEFGHWDLNHTFKLFASNQVSTVTFFYLYSLLMHDSVLFQSFGFTEKDGTPILIGLVIIIQFILSPLSHFLGLAANVVTRACEFQADEYAVKLGQANELASALVKLQKSNLGAMDPDPWFSAYHYSHPPLVERLNAIAVANSKLKKKSS